MGDYSRKQYLYEQVRLLREEFGITDSHYPINAIDLCNRKELAIVENVPFKMAGLRGMCFKAAQTDEKDIILINTALSIEEQSFTCGHELLHLALHRKEKVQSFSCFERAKPNQNPFIEWQANEGSAELHVPFRLLLAEIKKSYPTLQSWHDYHGFKSKLAKDFRVSDAVINFRLESLKYEIFQYLNDVNFEDIKFLSLAKQKEHRISIKSLNDIENEYMSEEVAKFKRIHSRTLDFSHIDIYNDTQKNPPLSDAPEKDGHYQQG